MDERTMREHYGTGYESARLAGGGSRIEFGRTKELLQRSLPPPPATVLDVGGGPGAYAAWLAGAGYSVHLIDPVPLHVKQAADVASKNGLSFTTAVGDARVLEEPEASFDVVMMLGPLYHLTVREDRLKALGEARRVTRPGGLIVVAAISRFASLLDGLLNGYLGQPAFDVIVERDLREGQHRNPTEHPDWFTTAYFHHPDELREEIRDAGLTFQAIFGVEGPGWLLPDLWENDQGRENILRAARAVEQESAMIGISAHLLAFARRES